MMEKQSSNDCLRNALEIVKQMHLLADEGDSVRKDVGCGVVFGMIRDCAYKIQLLAESEIQEHKKRGLWQEVHPVHAVPADRQQRHE